MHPSDPGYWKPPVKPARWPATDPPPDVLSTDPRPEGAPVDPSAVRKLQGAAERAGWAVRTGYALGTARAVRIGTYKRVESVGVWSSVHPATYLRFRAIYARTVGGKSWTWDIAIWGMGRPRFLDATITDLMKWIEVRGDVGAAWYKGVNARVEEQKSNARLAARNRTAKPKEGAS
jgi:hypothetical protein